jgi:GNAT superfamily N-acetyltransferase
MALSHRENDVGTQQEWARGEYTISTDRARIDAGVVHAFVATSYWGAGISREVVERSIEHSLCFGLYRGDARRGEGQVGFARVITDYATFAYVADVFVLPEHRGRKLSVWLMETIRAHPELQGLRVWRLATKDAHSLYEKVGFTALGHPERMMEIVDPMVYATDREGVDT